jgi:tetratricopeptide (TPR) repeat protein
MTNTTSTPQSLAEEAERVYQEGDFESAARLYGEAASTFQALGSTLDSAEMKNNQSVSFLQAGNPQSALDAVTGTADIFANAKDLRRQGIALANVATPLQSLGRLDEAVEGYLQASVVFKQAGEDQLYATVMQAVAGIHLRRGKIFEALSAQRAGLADLKNPSFTQKIMRGLLRLRLW